MAARVAARLLAATVLLFLAPLAVSGVDTPAGWMTAMVGCPLAYAKDDDRGKSDSAERQREKAERDREKAERERERARRADTSTNSKPAVSTGTTSGTSSAQQSQNGNATTSGAANKGNDSKTVKKNDDDDENDDDENDGRGKSGSAREQKVPDADVAPDTLVKFIDKWFSTGNSKGSKNADNKAEGSNAPVPPAAGVASNPRRGQPDFELLSLGSFRHRQIVASDLSDSAISQARSLGFKTSGSVSAPGLRRGVRRLDIPSGMSEVNALAMLREKFPEGHFGPNHIYHIRPAAEAEDESEENAETENGATAVAGAASPKSAPCQGDHCFAQALIGWRPHLKSCARSVRVGLIDTSFDTAHPAFKGRKFKLERFSSKQVDVKRDWHGTAVLSVLAGDSRYGAPGLVPEAHFLLASTFETDERGLAAADSIAILRALAWLESQKVEVVNMSFSGPANDLIEAAIDSMSKKGIIFVAAAGNGGVSGPASYPAAYQQVIAVTAVGKNRRSYRQANRGDYVDVAAPGVNVWTALPGGKHGYRTGTSFATPFVSGLLAAMPAARRNVDSKHDVLSRVTFRDLGAPGRDPIYGEGLPVAPKSCNEVGGVASLPWSIEHKRMSVGGPMPPPAARNADVVRPAGR